MSEEKIHLSYKSKTNSDADLGINVNEHDNKDIVFEAINTFLLQCEKSGK